MQVTIPKIVVIGSSNTDMIVKASRLPVPGETILGGNFLMNPGGKGANQAIAAKRLGADVSLVAKVGNDLFGIQAIEIYRSEMINTNFVFKDSANPSGVALISVDSKGENCIIVASGANMHLSPDDIDKAEENIKNCDLVLIQLEISMRTVEYAVNLAHKHGKRIILNPAPVNSLSNSLIKKLYAILPNKIEAEMLSGIKVKDEKSAFKAAQIISGKGVENVVITLGKMGAFVKEKDEFIMIPAIEVETVDSTGAGDVFCGAVSVCLAENKSLVDSVKFANYAAAISVTRIGAQSAIPFRREVNIFS